MKTEEKTKLYQRIHKLPPVSLTRVMDILPLENICGSTADIQIDLEALVCFSSSCIYKRMMPNS